MGFAPENESGGAPNQEENWDRYLNGGHLYGLQKTSTTNSKYQQAFTY